MKKRIFAMLLTLCILLGAAPAAFASTTVSHTVSSTCGENLKCVLDKLTGVLTISGTGAMSDNWHNNSFKDATVVVIEPGATTIGNGAFANFTELTSITIPDSVVSVGRVAFGNCPSLTNVVIPDSVTVIGDSAFSGCTNLTSAVLPKGITTIEREMFSKCEKMTSISIPNGVTTIGAGAFWRCKSLTAINIPDSVTSIGQNAFRESGLQSVEIPNGITTIAQFAFESCADLSSVTIPESVTKIESSAFSGCTSLTDIQIPGGVTAICGNAFLGCTGLSGVQLPDSVAKIEYGAFAGCTSLAEITIPQSVTLIGARFADCPVRVSPDNQNYQALDGVLFDKELKTLISCPLSRKETYQIPEGVTKIGEAAFAGCADLTKVIIPDSVTYIDGAAFTASGLTEITIPRGVTLIGESFRYCDKLTSVTIPDSVTSIGMCAFEHCTNLPSISIPDSVTFISNDAFLDCGMKEVTIPASVTDIAERAFGYKSVWVGVGNSDISVANMTGGTGYRYEPIEGFTIYGYSGTVAELYAKGNSFTFVPLGTTTTEPPVSSKFTDVPADAYYADPVAWAVKNGVTTGMTETTFAPENNCTRAQAVTFLWRAAGKPEPESASNPFIDVVDSQNTNWYYKAVLWAIEQGITTGTTAATFSPDEPCNRAQIVTFLYRHAGKPAANGGTFSDVTADQYYYQAVQWATANEITNGMGDGKFAPETDCSRGHIVTFLYRNLAK